MGVLAETPLHGYRIAQRLEGMAMFKDQPPDHGGIYRLLKAMEEDGLVVSTWDLSESGPAKRRYELTAEGRACLARWVRTLESYAQAVVEVLGLARTAA
jgi:DNA-binding PadR family transcriptional regulator